MQSLTNIIRRITLLASLYQLLRGCSLLISLGACSLLTLHSLTRLPFFLRWKLAWLFCTGMQLLCKLLYTLFLRFSKIAPKDFFRLCVFVVSVNLLFFSNKTRLGRLSVVRRLGSRALCQSSRCKLPASLSAEFLDSTFNLQTLVKLRITLHFLI